MSGHFHFLKRAGGNNLPVTDTRQRSSYRGVGATGCSVCPLNSMEKDLSTPKMLAVGPDDAKVYVLGEAPGKNEDEQGQAFVGKAGRTLRDHFPTRDDWEATRRHNTIRCRPPNNRDPAQAEVSACRGYIEEDIQKTRPKVIIGTGAVPLEWMIGMRPSITSWRGRTIPVKVGDHVCWYYPVIHPSYINRTGEGRSPHSQVLRRDIQRAIDLANSQHEPPYTPPERIAGGVVTYDGSDMQQLVALEKDLRRIARYKEVGYDYETWPLRPYHSKAQLISAAMGPSHDVVAFPIEHKDVSAEWTKAAKRLLAWFIANSGRKICHNLVFEMEWTANKFHPFLLRRTTWGDTQAQSYALREDDPKTKSLDNVVLQAFGFKLKEVSNLDRKDMRKHALQDVLDYNGLDSKWTHAVHQVQDAQMDEADRHEYRRILRTAPTVVMSQMKGVHPNPPEVLKQSREMEAGIEQCTAQILQFPEVTNFKLKHGKPFNPDSDPQVGEILYTEFNEVDVLTSGGGYSTKAEVLSELSNPFADAILKYRSLTHNVAFITRLDPSRRNSVVHEDGLVHTNYNLVFASTGRTTSDDPNLQNYPKRKMAKIRDCIRAMLGNVFVAVDYGSFEACVIAMASRDPVLIKYIWDGYDIHGDWTKRLLKIGGDKWKKFWWVKLDKPKTFDEFFKKLRNIIKNAWTFPLFFGSSYKSCARNLHMEEHLTKAASLEFWREFAGVKKWQDELFDFYIKHGYVQNLNGGRKRREPMTWNELINAPVQGSASDIVVDSWNRLSEQYDASQFMKPELQASMNIHDDLTFEVPKVVLDETIKTIVHMMLDVPFEWSKVVPLKVEVSVGETWGNLEDYGEYTNADWEWRYAA